MEHKEHEVKKTDLSILSEIEIKEYEEKAESLARELNVSKVHPIVLIEPVGFKRIVCYLKEPNYPTKIRVMDKMATLGIYTAADELREICTLREHSDSVTYGDSSECDRYKLGVTDYAVTLVQRLQNQFKKKQ